MADSRTTNRQMFWRILRRLLGANRGRLFVMLLALGSGAAITAALLNLQVDAKRRLTTEFRAFGANVVVAAPSSAGIPLEPKTISSSISDRIPAANATDQVARLELLYAVAQVQVNDRQIKPILPVRSVPLIVVGYNSLRDSFAKVIPYKLVQESTSVVLDIENCEIGETAAAALRVPIASFLELRTATGAGYCFVSEIRSFGGAEDSQVFLPLDFVQRITNSSDRISSVLLNVPGTPRQINQYIAALQKQLPDAEVRPIRQFTEGEAKIYNRISGLLTFTVALVLVLTGLCVLAAMTNVAMERRNDVGLMKAIGGATRRVLRLFLAEAALLGLAGGSLGAAAGIFLSIGLGKAVFGIAARPRLVVYPIAVALTIIVAVLSSYPLRRLAAIRPASVFRGEA